jgi:hypothetical protein
MDSLTLSVRSGPHHTFRAEGPPDVVRAEYTRFLETFVVRKHDGDGADTVPADLQGIFSVNKRGVVTLKRLPHTRDVIYDSLIVLLYGFQQLGPRAVDGTAPSDVAKVASDGSVASTDILLGATLSGLDIDRLDHQLMGRAVARVERVGGRKKGSRYRLNHDGEQHALAVIGQMAGVN